MHEMGVAMQIIEIATASIPTDMQSAKVARVNLKIGKLAAIVPDSLRFCFEIAAQETPLAGADLVIVEVPVVARCNDCEAVWTINGPEFICQKCKSGSIHLISGREIDIDSIEVANGDA